MKKLPGFLLLLLVALQPGCQKSGPAEIAEVKAHLQPADPASAGPPVDRIVLDSSSEVVVPINKIGVWPQTDSSAVAVRFVDTGKRVGAKQLRVVFLVSFRPL